MLGGTLVQVRLLPLQDAPPSWLFFPCAVIWLRLLEKRKVSVGRNACAAHSHKG